MDFSRSKYYEFNRMLLLSIGLWPYEESIFKHVKILITFSFMIIFTAAMIAKIITSKYDMIHTLRNLSMAIPCLIAILKYITFLLLPTSIKRIMERVQNDWNTLKDANELEIIQKYANFGRFVTITASVFGYICSLSLPLSIYLPGVLDFVVPLNVSRGRKLTIDVEYFIDEQKYFYIIFYHTYISVIFAITIVLATEMLYVAYTNHACGMFKIASYRLQHAYDQNVLQNSPFVKDAIVHTKIVAAIKMHRKALKFYNFLWSKIAVSYFILLFIGVASLTINLFRVFRTIVIVKNTQELLMSGIFVFIHFIYIFCGNYAGQVIIDHSMEIHNNVWDTRWYRVPLQQQKLIILILRRSLYSCKLITGGIFVLSLEGFASILATSISYFTVLTSVQR